MVVTGSIVVTLLLWLSTSTGQASAQVQADPFLVSPPGIWPVGDASQPSNNVRDLEFSLRHIYHHGTHRYPSLHRYLDVPNDAELSIMEDDGQSRTQLPPKLRARARPTNIERMVDRSRSTVDALQDQGRLTGRAPELPASAWTIDSIAGPDVTNKSTIISLAWMAANAYTEEPFTGDWHDVGGGFNNTDDFGWDNDGLRGHIFATEDNSTVVIGLKGTSAAIFDGPETTGNDKLNDNLFGSCCCAQQGDWMWKQVCECRTSTFNCNQTCLVQALREKSHYYQASQDLYHNVTERYPNSDVWFSGHSLGGVLGSLVGLTYGVPVVTFEAYPDAMAASRLGLPTPPGYRVGAHQSRVDTAIHHFGHTADPIFMGTCHGTWSPCSAAGYAFESACHTGKKCTYDTVNDKSWRVGIGNHKIFNVIKNVLEEYETVANCTEQLDCIDCYNWKFFESNGTEPSTSTSSVSTSTYTRTRTETCKTPGWWGCLDETTTTSSTSTSPSISTCRTPGWFGCKDPITITSPSPTPTNPPSAAPTITSITVTTTTTQSISCETAGWFDRWFGQCKEPATGIPSRTSSPTSSSSIPTSSNSPNGKRRQCVSRHWYGICKEWAGGSQEPKNDL